MAREATASAIVAGRPWRSHGVFGYEEHHDLRDLVGRRCTSTACPGRRGKASSTRALFFSEDV
jgi:hypothetical protein